MTTTKMAKVCVAGQGSYGIVYVATDARNLKTKNKKKVIDLDQLPKDELYAVKRNFKEPLTAGYGNLREANMMKILSGHPYIVNLLEIRQSDPFKESGRAMTPIGKTTFSSMSEDKMHFVMEYLPYNAEEYIAQEACTPSVVKVLIMELLLAIEFMHSQGVVHRDIRTSNILVAADEDGGHELKLCDFGLSRVMGDECSTPGTITSWYRAPEVCCSYPYGKKADIWSAGCVIYELVSGKALLKGTKDNDSNILNAILARLPETPNRKLLHKLVGENRKMEASARNILDTTTNRSGYVERMALSAKFKRQFEAIPGSLEELDDLLNSMLCLDPDERISATRALNHPFFDWTREHIELVRKEYPPEPPPLPFYEIRPCAERRWVTALAFNLYNRNVPVSREIDLTYPGYTEVATEYIDDNCLEWYSHRVLFHGLDLFDQYLVYRLEEEKGLREHETELMGRILTRSEAYLYFYCCLYIMHKYYSTLEIPRDWDQFAPAIYKDARSKRDAILFEELIVNKVTKIELFRKTLLEISSEFKPRLTSSDRTALLFKLGTLEEEWTDRSVRALYRHLNNIPSPAAKKVHTPQKK